jgi:Uncharacterized ABC-type transport system, permease component
MTEILTSFLASNIRTTTPLLLAALGTVYSERSGVTNIGVEGTMLIGAFTGVIASYYTGSAWLGGFFAMLSGVIVSLIIAFFSITIKANQVIVGTAVNIFAGGFTITLNRLIFGVSTSVTTIDSFKEVSVPLLCNIPVLGTSVFTQTLPGYFAFLFVPVAWFVMQKTKVGLIVRAVGENPHACATMGIDVIRARYLSMLYSGLMIGLAGAFVSMGSLSSFTEGMVAGRGFIVLAAVVVGNYTPVGVLLATLLFGASSALQFRLMAGNATIPYQFWSMLPYIITVIAICVYRKGSNAPAASGRAYSRE